MSFATNKLLSLILCVIVYTSFSQNKFTSYTKDNGLTSNTIFTSTVDSRGIVWVGTTDGVSAFVHNKWIKVKSISDNSDYKKNIGRVSIIFETSKGEIWIASDKGVFIYNREFWTYFNDSEDQGFVVTDIFEDRNGWVWVMLEKYQSLKDVSSLGFSMVEGDLQMYDGEKWHKFTTDLGGTAAINIGDEIRYFTSHIIDMDGNLWVSNMDGVCKFNGNRWIEFEKKKLSLHIIYEVVQSKDKSIWVASKKGIAKQGDDSWITYTKEKGIKGNNIVSVFADKHNRIWATAKKDNRLKYLCMNDNGKWKSFSRDQLGFKGEIIHLLDFNNQVLAFSKKGISLFNNSSWSNIIKENNIDDDNFSFFKLTSNSTAVFTGRKGLYEIIADGLKTVYIIEDGWKPSTLFVDNNDNIWVGTSKEGLFFFDNNSAINYTIEDGLSSDNLIDIFQDKQNNIWVVTRAGISMIISETK